MTLYVNGKETISGPQSWNDVITLGPDATIVATSYTATTGVLWDFKCTPGSAADTTIMRIEADGTNWSGGSCLYIRSDDNSCTPLTLDLGVAFRKVLKFAVAGTETGNIKSGTGNTGMVFGTVSGYDIQFLPDTTGITVVGDAGTTSHSLASNDDLFVAGKLEVDSNAYFDAGVSFTGTNGSIILNGGKDSIEDDASVTIIAHASTSGWLAIQAGDDEEWMRCRFQSDGTVTKETGSANTAVSDSDTDLCCYSTGGNVVIKNRLGATKSVVYEINSYAI